MSELTRPIIGIENRTPQEVFDIMCDRITRHRPAQLMSEDVSNNRFVFALNNALVRVGAPKGWKWDINDIAALRDAVVESLKAIQSEPGGRTSDTSQHLKRQSHE